MSSYVRLKTECPICFNSKDFILQTHAYEAWKKGVTVQTAFPDLDIDDRERLITGICPACWKELFRDTDEFVDPKKDREAGSE